MPKHKQTEQPNYENAKRGIKQAPVRTVKRSQINPAPYNPRSISDYARKQLEKSLSRFGLVETLVWNEQTGNLCSGHQRLSVLDKRNGYPGNDYELEVSVVNLDAKREKELNVWLNNQAAQGHFERESFLALLGDVSLEDIGFTAPDLEFEFGSIDGFESVLGREEKESDPVKRDINAIKDRKKQVRNDDKVKPEEDADYYLMVVFESANAKEQWLRENQFPAGVRFISYAEFSAASMGLVGDQGGVIQQAINHVRQMEGEPEMKASRCLELIAADYLSGN